ncbi:MAG: BON domain-containing protein [Pirellulales bacterium]|nr:BON domain-containing protein [Pirellulales bacterium]
MEGEETNANRGSRAESAGEISAAAKRRIVHEPHLAAQRIWCEFDGARLVLRGQVPSYYCKQLAQEAVADLEGVERIVNEIEVLW